MQPIPNPSGSTMMARGNRVYDRLDELLPRIRPISGSYPQAWVRYCQRYCQDKVKVSYHKSDGSLHIHFYKFIYLQKGVPSPETVRRRCQEIFRREKKKIWVKVDAKYPKEQFSEEIRKQEFLRLAALNKYLPSARVLNKRELNEEAHHEYFGAEHYSQKTLDTYRGMEG